MQKKSSTVPIEKNSESNIPFEGVFQTNDSERGDFPCLPCKPPRLALVCGLGRSPDFTLLVWNYAQIQTLYHHYKWNGFLKWEHATLWTILWIDGRHKINKTYNKIKDLRWIQWLFPGSVNQITFNNMFVMYKWGAVNKLKLINSREKTLTRIMMLTFIWFSIFCIAINHLPSSFSCGTFFRHIRSNTSLAL